ncbi:toll/interleukin-1 receptor domain-containing protein [Streptomyces sp. NPDC093591]|uniref:toll/interleukin-1 receptor domain-containing protein n=1 Tax=Streptomyces sp. NPDC093591 TaxID=3366044 RepID=UPI0037FCFA8D
MSSKKSKINSALRAAEAEGRLEAVLSAAADFIGFESIKSQTPPQSNRDLAKPEAENKLSNGGSIFISHAFKDKDLASTLKNILVLGGVPNDRIFFSSERSTGIPAGKGVLEHLQTTLSSSSLVIEVITRDFLTRPYCLMELGGAWALGKRTFPLVVPPLTISEAVHAIGSVHMRVLGSEAEMDSVFDELHDTLNEIDGISLNLRQWKESIRAFTQTVGRDLRWHTQEHKAPTEAKKVSRSAPQKQVKKSSRAIADAPNPAAAEDEGIEMAASELRAALKRLNWVTRVTVMRWVTWDREPYRADADDAREAIEKREVEVDENIGALYPLDSHPAVRKAILLAESWKEEIEEIDPEYAEKFEEENEIPLDARSADTWEAFNLT